MRQAAPKGLLLVAEPTCFTRVAGIPLLHRALLTGHRAGIPDWLILTWVKAHEVQTSLRANATLKGVLWQVIDMRPPTTAAAVRHALPGGEVLVIPCTAVFDHRAVRQLQHETGIVIGYTASQIDATAVRPTTGMWRCPSDLLGHLMEEQWPRLQQSPDPALLLQHRLLEVAPVKTVDLSQQVWVPLTPPLATSVAAAETQLLHRLGRDGDSVVVRLMSRRLSRALTKRLLHTSVTPNQITLVSGLIGICGALLLAQPLRFWQVLGSLLFLLSTILDGCDGETARLTFRESNFGAKLDVIMDNIVHVFLFSGIALGLYWQSHQTLYLILGGLTLGGVLLSMALYVPYLWRPSPTRRPQMRLHESLASRDFAYLLPLLTVFGVLDWFLWAAAIGTYGFAAALGGLSLFQRPQGRNASAK